MTAISKMLLIDPDDGVGRRRDQRVTDCAATLLKLLRAIPPELRATAEAAARAAFETALEQLLPDEETVSATKIRRDGDKED